MKRHTEADNCPNQPFACMYCDQKYTYYKSVTKHIWRGSCRALNNYRVTRDSLVLARESNVGKEVNRHMVTVTDQNIPNEPGFVEVSPDNLPAKENVGKQNIMGKIHTDN